MRKTPRIQEARKVFIFTDQFYFGTGRDIPEAIENARKAGGRGTSRAHLKLFIGPAKDIEEMRVDGGGGVHYNPHTVIGYDLGVVKIPMKQSAKKMDRVT